MWIRLADPSWYFIYHKILLVRCYWYIPSSSLFMISSQWVLHWDSIKGLVFIFSGLFRVDTSMKTLDCFSKNVFSLLITFGGSTKNLGTFKYLCNIRWFTSMQNILSADFFSSGLIMIRGSRIIKLEIELIR